jgi:hypothetical protein
MKYPFSKKLIVGFFMFVGIGVLSTVDIASATVVSIVPSYKQIEGERLQLPVLKVRRGGYRRGGRGFGSFVGGAIVGGAIASAARPRYYGPRYYRPRYDPCY